ncbi:uncharacterized protein LOC105917773 isoform X1 [Fundulus heteroclitus]|uniref:uncharacterized protein LOC105917773 isoform X1 n=1 Tax=Fundulus heteroclitus TaxID=8078 RepID=UPI00165BDE4C|nr:uncharacterized protein LOC105917773 isoform X1 [Fundulus heteroclitus]
MGLLFPGIACLLLFLQQVQAGRDDRTSCKPVTASFCQGLGYSSTPYPNGVQGFSLHQIGQMVETACSPHIATVMCRVVVPECGSENESQKKPCRALCEKVRRDCESTLRAKWLFWPIRLRCDSLPVSNCVQGQEISVTEAPPATCQAITVRHCSDLPYRETILPNSLGHRTQDEAALEMQQFASLLRMDCSPHLKPFLCSVYIPKCVSAQPQPPCRSLCQQARSGCASLMSRTGFQWPESLKCESFTSESCEALPDSNHRSFLQTSDSEGSQSRPDVQRASRFSVSPTGISQNRAPAVFPQQVQPVKDDTSCKPVTSSFCQGVGYKSTRYPSGVQGYNLHQIGQIVQTACSPHVNILMCRVAVPECGSGDESRVKPCRALCEQVKKDCESTLSAKRLIWPSMLRCESLPRTACVQGPPDPITPAPSGTCEPITVSICEDISYTNTVLPNILGHRSQQEAGLAIHQFIPLIKVECSPQLKPFLCSVYTPKCVSGKPQPPCRTLCEKAQSGCGRLMSNFGFPWPDALRCESFTTESCEESLPFNIPGTCQTMTAPFCKDLPYTEAFLPNSLGHKTQEEANLALHGFLPLDQLGCSAQLKPFLCSVHLPKCASGKGLAPCRTLCEQARSGCEPLMNRFGLNWPENLKCEAFTTESCEQYGLRDNSRMCEPITIPMCQGLSYNQTIFPNLLGHASQRDAVMKMSFFNSIVQTVCSADIQLFLCRVYTPECVEGQVQRPCRSFCEKARRNCEGLMSNYGVSWPNELRCDAFPEEMCISENNRKEVLMVEDVLSKLKTGGYTVLGKSLTLKTAHLLLTLMDTDKTGDLDVVEFFKLEHYVAVIRREYVENYESRTLSAVTQTQMKKAIAFHDFKLDEETFRALWVEYSSQDGIDYDAYVALLTKLKILKDRFQAHLLNLACDCRVASFSFKQFMKSAII